jgi:TonB family protein
VLEVMIRKDGSASPLKVVRGLGYGLDESAVETVKKKWRFKPGMKDGKPVEVKADIEIQFSLW